MSELCERGMVETDQSGGLQRVRMNRKNSFFQSYRENKDFSEGLLSTVVFHWKHC